MPRPELSLYRDRAIARKHHVLLVDVTGLHPEDYGVVRSSQKPTGIVANDAQLDELVLTTPTLVRCLVVDFWDKEIGFYTSWLKRQLAQDISGVVFEVPFGNSDELAYRDFVSAAGEYTHKRRIDVLTRIRWERVENASVAMTSLAVRHCLDAKADYIIIDMSPHYSIESIQTAAGEGEVLVAFSNWNDDQTPLLARRVVAEGARGVVIEASCLLGGDFTMNMRLLSHSVFGLDDE